MTAGDRIVRLPEAKQMIGVSHMTLWRWEKAGTFPTRIHIGPRAIGWRLSDLQAWIATREQAA